MNIEIAGAAQRAWRAEIPFSVKILETRQESRSAKTLFFRRPECDPLVAAAGETPSLRLGEFYPGRFVMAWLPRLDEKPFTISYLDEERFGITVLSRGPFTRALHSLKAGDWVGLRGPYGRGFTPSRNAAVVGGGVGMATMATLIERLQAPAVFQGASTACELLFLERFPGMAITTDDGTMGRRGFVTDAFEDYLSGCAPAMVYACGPEPMMAKVVQMCNKRAIPCQVSLERYMKCGFGVCGQCCCGGRRVCRDGPVFDAKDLALMPDFGRFARLKSGSRVDLAAYLGKGGTNKNRPA